MSASPGIALAWRRLCDAAEALSRIIVGGAILAIVSITILSVWYRYALNDPLSWTEQVCRILFVWSVFAGAAILYRQMLHIAIDMLVVMLPPGLQKIVGWTNQVLMLLTGILMLIGIRRSLNEWRSQRRQIEVLLGVMLAQIFVGYLQYFSGVPSQLVAIHIAVSMIIVIAATDVLWTATRKRQVIVQPPATADL